MNIFRWFKRKPNLGLYVVIYDSALERDYDTEQYYGYFDNSQEAKQMFWSAFKLNEVRNVKLCKIVEHWPSSEDP